jgi:hypothetical protein
MARLLCYFRFIASCNLPRDIHSSPFVLLVQYIAFKLVAPATVLELQLQLAAMCTGICHLKRTGSVASRTALKRVTTNQEEWLPVQLQ